MTKWIVIVMLAVVVLLVIAIVMATNKYECFDGVPSTATTVVAIDNSGEMKSMNTNDFFNMLIPKGLIVAWNSEAAPKGWAICNGNNGQPINDVVIPDLRGKFVYGSIDNKNLHATGGKETHALTIDEFPNHTHEVQNNINKNNSCSCGGGGCGCLQHKETTNGLVIGTTGNNKPHENMPPYLVLNYIIKVT